MDKSNLQIFPTKSILQIKREGDESLPIVGEETYTIRVFILLFPHIRFRSSRTLCTEIHNAGLSHPQKQTAVASTVHQETILYREYKNDATVVRFNSDYLVLSGRRDAYAAMIFEY